MKLMPRDIVLLVIEEAGGSVQGKTLLQKRIYFLSLSLDLKLGYRPYYYGPYSPIVDDALGDLKGLRFVEERERGFRAVNEEGFKVKRYDYELTDDGKLIVERIKKRYPDERERIVQALQDIRQAGEPDYNTLSVAAKAHFILSSQGEPMTAEEIINVARQFNWKISEDEFREAASFLEKLNLVKSRQ